MFAVALTVADVAPLRAAEIEEISEIVIKKKHNRGTTPSGVTYSVVRHGTGAKPRASDRVRVHYVGRLSDGTVFDSSRARGQPADVVVSDMIVGWQDALTLMPAGSTWRIRIPSHLGYGAEGAGGVIPPNADLLFEIELMEILDQ